MTYRLELRRVVLLVALAAVMAWVGSLRPASAAPTALDDESRWTSGRALRKEITVDAELSRVWHAWTTTKGITSFFATDADIEMDIGGKYEIYMNPDPAVKQRGCEGCTVRSYIPQEMLAFDWTSPPSIPSLRNAGIMTQVVLRFERVPDGVRVRFTQLGFGEGDHWDRNYAYFDAAWSNVLTSLKTTLEADSAYAVKPKVDPPKSVRSVDGRVTVTSHVSPVKYQDFEIVLPAPTEKVWGLIATNEGLRDMLHKEATIELKPGGLYRDWPGNDKKVLAFVPGEMLSGVGGAPPKFPSVQKGGTWWVYRLEPVDSTTTRLRMAVLGWHEHDGKEWTNAFDYFLKNNPIYLNQMLYPKAVATKIGVRDRVYRTAARRSNENEHLAPLARMVGGSWVSTSIESDGGVFKTRVVNEWGLDGKIIKGRSYVTIDGEEKLVYETVMAWHPTREEIVFWSFSSWDSLYEGTIKPDGEALTWAWTGYSAKKVTRYRQTINFQDDNTYVWTVFTETKDGWEQSKKTTFHRV